MLEVSEEGISVLKLDDLIIKLLRLQAEHGNIPVKCNPEDGHPTGSLVGNLALCENREYVFGPQGINFKVNTENPQCIYISE